MAACDDDPCTAPVVPATPVMKGISHLTRSRRVWTRSRNWLVVLSIVLVAAFSACAFVEGAAVTTDVDTADEIVVGKETYRTPFTQYPPLVADTLKTRSVDQGQSPDAMIAQADWLLFLGMAHRRTLELKVELTEADFQEVSKSANALQQGIAWMEHLRDKYPAERLTATLRMAELYVNLGETYNLSANDDEYKLAMDYFVRGEDIYRQTLESKEAIAWGNDDGSDQGASRVEVEIRWAHCCHRIGVALLAMAQEIAHTTDLDSALLTDPESIQLMMASMKEKLQANALMAEVHLRKAVTIFSKVSKGGYKNTKNKDYQMDEVEVERHFATALSNLGTALGMTGDLEAGIEYSEQALEVYQKLYPRLPQGDVIAEDAIMDISDMMYTLAEQHLQLGKYDKAKQHYSRAMEWNSDNNIAPPEDLGEFVQEVSDLDDAIEEHEAQLEAYNVLNNQGMDIGVSEYDEEYRPYQGKDELYEGDIHMSLGSLSLAKGDLVSAESHLSQSIKLYEISGEEEDRNLADAKFNMSVLKYRTGDYALSREYYDSALDIYRDVVGPGIDPRMAGMDASEIPRASPRAPVESKAEMQTESETKKQNVKGGAVHEDWVDLEDLKEMRKNATIREEL